MKKTLVPILAGLVLVGAISFLAFKPKSGSEAPLRSIIDTNSMSTEDQVIEISAKGGYFLKETTAKSGIPTRLKITTNGTFDCSASLTIPAIGYKGYLPPSATTFIDVPPQATGTTLRGICSMGMYSFALNFI